LNDARTALNNALKSVALGDGWVLAAKVDQVGVLDAPRMAKANVVVPFKLIGQSTISK
jgi:hypothetical protein